jgi:hypothetical protein
MSRVQEVNSELMVTGLSGERMRTRGREWKMVIEVQYAVGLVRNAVW